MTLRLVTSGGAAPDPRTRDEQLDWVLAKVGRERPRVCFLPTASGDSDLSIARFYEAFEPLGARCDHLALFRRRERDPTAFLRAHDLVWVGGGNTANLLAVWTAHGVIEALRAAAARDVVLGGSSAGAVCWFGGTVTDAFGELTAWRGGLQWLSGSFCPHWDSAPERRDRYVAAIREGALPPGHACDDGAAIWWVDGAPTAATGGGWRVDRDGVHPLRALDATASRGSCTAGAHRR